MDGINWFKVKSNYLDGSSFKFMRRAKIDGVGNLRDKLESVWFELLALAAKVNNDGFFYNDEVDYQSNLDLAIMLDREEEEINICMKFYLKHQMISVVDNRIKLTNWDKYQNIKSLDAVREKQRIRVQRYREKQKKLQKLENHVEVETCNVTRNATSNATDMSQVTLPSQENIRIREIENIRNREYKNIRSKELENKDVKNKEKELTNKDIAHSPDGTNERPTALVKSSPRKPKDKSYLKEFERFYANYPRKIGKAMCKKWFEKHKPDQEFTDKLIEAVNKQKLLPQWSDPKFIPYPATWLNQKRYEDDDEDFDKIKKEIDKSYNDKAYSEAYSNVDEEKIANLDLDEILGE